MNKCILIGNLTRDPELTQTQSGISVCKFGIAVNRTYSNANGEKEVDFFNIVAWRGLGENCSKYLSKGSKVAVFGEIQTRTYEDKDGNKKSAIDIVASDVEFVGSRNADNGGGNYGGGQREERAAAPKKQVSELKAVVDDDLPF